MIKGEFPIIMLFLKPAKFCNTSARYIFISRVTTDHFLKGNNTFWSQFENWEIYKYIGEMYFTKYNYIMTQFSYYHNYMMIWILVVCTFYIDIHFILLTIWCITLHLNKANCVCDNQSFRRFLYNICKRSGVVAIKFNFLFKFVLIINYESPNVPIQRRSISIINLVHV